jgi:hypothetical protein
MLRFRRGPILLTEDKDFGWLVFAGRMNPPGVIPIRFPASARNLLAQAVLKLVSEYAVQLEGAFVVLQPGVARISFGPTTGDEVRHPAESVAYPRYTNISSVLTACCAC